MALSNPYMHGQIWAQAMASGRALLRQLDPLLTTRRFGRVIASFRDVGSTNDVAAAWASEGCAEGAVVVAEHQHAGRGRFGRTWSDDAGKNLMFTMVLRPTLRPEALGLVMVAASVAVADSLSLAEPSLPVTIKWPNDVLLRGRKCCGILMESSTSGARSEHVDAAVVGMGLNVNQDEFPVEHADRATSLALEAGHLFHRTPILATILNRFEYFYNRVGEDDGEEVRREYLARLAAIGELVDVFVAGSDEPLHGRIRGISPTGALLLETALGLRTLASGEVSFRRSIET